MNTLKANENRGYQIEQEIAAKFPSYTMSNKGDCYDFSTPTALIEVKSCHWLIKDGKKHKLWRHGRFYIHKDSHEYLKERAESKHLHPIYIFALLNDDHTIASTITLTREYVNHLLILEKPCHRGDYIIDYRRII